MKQSQVEEVEVEVNDKGYRVLKGDVRGELVSPDLVFVQIDGKPPGIYVLKVTLTTEMWSKEGSK